MKDILQEIEKDLAPLPQVALQVMQMVEDPDSNATDLADLISQDQALTSRVLRMANSAYYGVRGSIEGISRAVVTLGWSQVHTLVVAASCQAQHQSTTFSDQVLWDHALAVSQGARRLVARCGLPLVDQASTAGLLHDIGKLVLDRHVADQYTLVVAMVQDLGVSFLEAEQETFGFTHADVGGIVLRKWGMPPALIEAVELHHDPGKAEVNPSLCATVSLANSICVQQGIGFETVTDLDLMALDSTAMLGLDEEELNEVLDEFVCQEA